MTDTEAEIRGSINAIRQVANAHLAITQPEVRAIERQVATIIRLTMSADVASEGARLVASALGSHSNRENKAEIVRAARLHGAIARFEFALQQLGFLPAEEEESPPPRGRSLRGG
jgi:hypothetical protein